MAILKRYLCLFATFLLFALAPAMHAYAADDLQLQEEAIKAGLLYNFLKYIEWPSGSAAAKSTTAVVCILGADPFDGYLQPMAGRTVNRRTIAIRNIQDIGEADSCQLVFVSADEKDRWPQLLKFLAGKNILTVGDFENFSAAGGMIEFGRKGDHISVQLNIDSVSAAHLRVEDRLLKLVTVVHSGGP